MSVLFCSSFLCWIGPHRKSWVKSAQIMNYVCLTGSLRPFTTEKTRSEQFWTHCYVNACFIYQQLFTSSVVNCFYVWGRQLWLAFCCRVIVKHTEICSNFCYTKRQWNGICFSMHLCSLMSSFCQKQINSGLAIHTKSCHYCDSVLGLWGGILFFRHFFPRPLFQTMHTLPQYKVCFVGARWTQQELWSLKYYVRKCIGNL